MAEDVTAEYVKSVRAKYGMTQKAFARVLGVGEASVIRYEQGQKPTKAMANLIRAAARPEFMADCLDRDGDALTKAQRENAEKMVYALISFDERGEVMDIDEIYELTLEQEVLNEKAALVIADALRRLHEAEEQNDAAMEAVCHDVLKQLSKAKQSITAPETDTMVKLAEVRGQIAALELLMKASLAKVA